MPAPPTSLPGAVVAITGSARGIGKATAHAFTRAGARVAIGDLDAGLAEQAAKEVGGGAIGLALDVTDRESLDAYIAQTEEQLGPIDVFVNNAGIMPLGHFLDEPADVAHRQIEINIHGVINGMKAILPKMIERRRGTLVNIASAAGKGGFPGVATYCGTKHAVVGITEAVRMELRDEPINFGLVMPAIVRTELTSGVASGRGIKDSTPEDVADAIVHGVREARFEIYVPRAVGTIGKAMQLLPRRAREGLAHAMKADQVMLTVDQNARLAYTQRIEDGLPSAEKRSLPAGDRSE
jgi:NADP-dependent 3-hydroxy acid dehydrogenase YdfG